MRSYLKTMRCLAMAGITAMLCLSYGCVSAYDAGPDQRPNYDGSAYESSAYESSGPPGYYEPYYYYDHENYAHGYDHEDYAHGDYDHRRHDRGDGHGDSRGHSDQFAAPDHRSAGPSDDGRQGGRDRGQVQPRPQPHRPAPAAPPQPDYAHKAQPHQPHGGGPGGAGTGRPDVQEH